MTDPVSAGLVDSIQKPGGLITGTSDLAPIDKQIGSAQQALPQAKKVGILYTTSEGNSEVQVKEASKEFEKKGYQIIKKGISSSNDVQDATASLMKDVDFVFVPTDNTIASTMSMIGELSRTHKVPVIGGSTDMVDAGGLLTYGTNYEQLGRQVARMAIQVLKGKNPADLAVQYPKKLDLHINHEMAQQLGIDLSQLTKD